jgi:FG-GAP-like repeat
VRKLVILLLFGIFLAFGFATVSWAGQSAKSTPPDTTPYSRPVIPSDRAVPPAKAEAPLGSGVNLVIQDDTVVNNTDTNLKNTDTFGDGETSIAINPNDHNDIVISAFSGAWGTWPAGYPSYAPLWVSHDGGHTWTKEFTVTQPYGIASNGNCPCDQTYDFETRSVGGPDDTYLNGTILAETGDLYTGHTYDPTVLNAWFFAAPGSGDPPYKTNLAADSSGKADQPWMLNNRSPASADAQDVYVAYGDFGTNPVGDRVAASLNTNGAPVFSGDVLVGTTAGAINPGHRLAKDPRNGTMWSLYQTCVSNCANLTDNPKTIAYRLNRSTDQGATWTLNGSSTGILVSEGLSTQPEPKFGTVNALLGGVDHGAVDPSTGDLYYVWGSADSNLNNGLLIIRIYDNGSGGVSSDTFHFVFAPTSGMQAALPSVAVTRHGTVGVFYYTYNGMVSGYPQFTTWLATSKDKGATFNTRALATFLSPATDNGDGRQRVFGDFMQMKAVDNCFYGSYTGNGAVFGRSVSNNDPIFFKACVPDTFTHDFDDDGNSDVLWRQTGGKLVIWKMNGEQSPKFLNTSLSATTAWQVQGTGDFDDDGAADILWRNSNGQVAVWLMNGGQVNSSKTIGTATTDWQIAGTGDFDGDGKSDILWRNTGTGKVSIWKMNGTNAPSFLNPGTATSDWQIAGTGDFDGDGTTDILWRNTGTGKVVIWLMKNGTVKSYANASLTATNDWHIAGTGDFDGDGRADILWRQTSTGKVAIWEMNGGQVKSSKTLATVATAWQIAGTGDFDGGGTSDILWRNSNGQVAVWLMNGEQIASTKTVGTATADWQIQPED